MKKNYRPYTVPEIQAIQSRYVAEGAGLLAQEQDRAPRAIRVKAWALGIRRKSDRANRIAHQWTEAEDLLLRKEWGAVTSRKKSGHNVSWLAKKIGLSPQQCRSRAAHLGLARQQIKEKEKPWTEDEIELLHQTVHFSSKHQATLFRKKGFHRTQTALVVARQRFGVQVHESADAYSANGLARLMGVTTVATCGWIRRGWLKAKPRTDATDAFHGGVGDRWLILPKDVRRFICDYISHLDLSAVDKYWLVDLLVDPNTEGWSAKIQQKSGTRHEAAGGYEEYGVAA